MAKLQELALMKCADALVKVGDAAGLKKLLVDVRPYFALIAKSKTAKIGNLFRSLCCKVIVRSFLDRCAAIPNSETIQMELCRESIEWSRNEKRTFLRHRVEARLVELLLRTKDVKGALKLLESLLREVKRLDDKMLLVELHMLESSCYMAFENLARAKAALTSARACSNAIYCPPLLQAQIDSQAGCLCAEENDYKTGFSYFYESFEGYNSLDMPLDAVKSLKYMLLCKIMTNNTSV